MYITDKDKKNFMIFSWRETFTFISLHPDFRCSAYLLETRMM